MLWAAALQSALRRQESSLELNIDGAAPQNGLNPSPSVTSMYQSIRSLKYLHIYSLIHFDFFIQRQVQRLRFFPDSFRNKSFQKLLCHSLVERGGASWQMPAQSERASPLLPQLKVKWQFRAVLRELGTQVYIMRLESIPENHICVYTHI